MEIINPNPQNFTPLEPKKRHLFKLAVFFFLIFLIIVTGLGIGFALSENKTRTTVDAYGKKLAAGEDYEKGIILFGLKEKFLTVNGKSLITSSLIDKLDKTNPSSLLAVFDKYKVLEVAHPFNNVPVFKNVYLLKVPTDTNILDLMTSLQKNENVEFAEPNYYAKLAYAPNDYFFSKKDYFGKGVNGQWNLEIIDMPKAWDITKGSNKVVVGVIDSGVDNTNPDLDGNVIEGYWIDMFYPIVSMGKGFPGDCFGTHGTHVAGIIAAKGNDNYGVTGVAPEIKIMPLSNSACGKTEAKLLRAITVGSLVNKAAEEKLSVINMSFSMPVSLFLNRAVDDAVSKGVVAVAASGNYSKVIDQAPANNPNAIVVSSVSSSDEITNYSNYGSTITVAAPGGDFDPKTHTNAYIMSTASTQVNLLDYIGSGTIPGNSNKHIGLHGTSMAAPHVSGLAALVKSLHPDWSPRKIRCAIILGTDDKGTPGWDEKYGYGRINAFNTLSLSEVPEDCIPEAKINDPNANSGVNTINSVTVNGTAFAKNIDYFSLEYLSEGANPKTGWQLISKINSQSIKDNTLSDWDLSNLNEGNYNLRLKVKDKFGHIAIDEVPLYLFKDKKAKKEKLEKKNGQNKKANVAFVIEYSPAWPNEQVFNSCEFIKQTTSILKSEAGSFDFGIYNYGDNKSVENCQKGLSEKSQFISSEGYAKGVETILKVFDSLLKENKYNFVVINTYDLRTCEKFDYSDPNNQSSPCLQANPSEELCSEDINKHLSEIINKLNQQKVKVIVAGEEEEKNSKCAQDFLKEITQKTAGFALYSPKLVSEIPKMIEFIKKP